MSMKFFDVLILGGGPAGSSAGLTLLKRDGVSVAIVEKSAYSEYRVGESLTPGARPLLEYLQIWDAFKQQQSLHSFGSEAAWGSSDISALDYMFTMHGPGWALDRLSFDQMLSRLFINRGGTLLLRHTVLDVKRVGTKWQVRVMASNQQEERVIFCSYIVDATGRSRSIAEKCLGAKKMMYDKLFGVVNIGYMPKDYSTENNILLETCEYGWWYTIPLPDNRMLVTFMSDIDIIKHLNATEYSQWFKLLQEMRLTYNRINKVKFRDKPQIFSAVSAYLEQAGGEGWVAVGDAVASHDPLSSTGIAHAMGSGIQGALVAANTLFASGGMLQVYQKGIRQDYHEYLKTRWQYYSMENRWGSELFWKRRTSVVSVDPSAVIDSINLQMVNNPSPYVSHRVQEYLLEKCYIGQKVHEVISAVKGRYDYVPDQHLILCLQDMIAHQKIGIVKNT